jgi:DNA-binding CsgD family transcriptional regulator
MPHEEEREFHSGLIGTYWPDLKFLGLGIWWAWVLLLYSSTSIDALMFEDYKVENLWWMYIISTTSLAISLLIAALLWRKLTPERISNRVVYAFGLVATVSTLVVAYAPLISSPAFIFVFIAASALTGIGTSVVCLKVGQVYGSVGLGESIAASFISVVLASMLYFVCIGLPDAVRNVYTAALPLAAMLLLCSGVQDPFDVSVPGDTEERNPKERSYLRRLLISIAVIAFTAGMGKAVIGTNSTSATYAQTGALCVFLSGLLGVCILVYLNRKGAEQGVGKVYTALIVLGIAIELATCFGFNIMYLSVGEEDIWFMFTALLAFLAFRYNASPVRIFGFGQASYFFGSLVGWVVGYCVAPWFADSTMRVAIGIVLAFLVVIVYAYVLPEREISELGNMAREQLPLASAGDEATEDKQPGAAEEVPEPADPYARARDPRYGLSARELEVMELFAQGRSATWIAEKLSISKNTVRTHLRSVYNKLSVHTRQELLDFMAGSEDAER